MSELPIEKVVVTNRSAGMVSSLRSNLGEDVRRMFGMDMTMQLAPMMWAVLTDDLEPGAVGKAELRGTAWTVRNAAAERLHRGQRCRVHRVDGLMLWVGPE